MDIATDIEKVDKPHDIRIITFNLLSPDVMTDKSMMTYFPKIKEKYMDFEYRLDRTKKLLSSWFRVNFIICLQEMSKQWRDRLEGFFEENDYKIISEGYSGDRFGVGIAYPIKHFDLLAVDLDNCGSIIKPIYNTIVDNKDEENEKQYSDLVTELEHASRTDNVLLAILLRAKYYGKETDKNILITTYHMPCRWTYINFTCIHIYALKKYMTELAKKWTEMYKNVTAIIFAGDLNIKAECFEYNFLLDNPQNDYMIKYMKEQCKKLGIDLYDVIKLRSAHMVCNGEEPIYTNVMIQKGNKFIECIDYILINDIIDVRSSTTGLSVPDPTKAPSPNGLCPSDHLPLSASLIIR